MLTAALLALACQTYEAQVVTKVKEIHKIANEPYACELVLDINLSKPNQSYRPHFICPLDIDEVVGKRVYSRHCDYRKGDALSGYLVKTAERIELE